MNEELNYPYQRQCFKREMFLTASFAHDFQPRYEWVIDWEEIRKSGIDLNKAYALSGISSLAESIGRKMYIRDVCVRCGMTIERAKEPVQDLFSWETKSTEEKKGE